jgi:hypothetical protein
MIIDVHCHYTLTARRADVAERFSFEPPEHEGRPAYDSCVAPRLARQLKWKILRRIMRLPRGLPSGPELDEHVEAFYCRHLLADGPIERFVLLAFDEYHDDSGRRRPFPSKAGERGSDIYTSNTLVRDLCRRHPDRFLFGASVHPYRPGAVAAVEEVFAAGACLLKWIPLHQNVDVADPRTVAVLEKCAELGLPILVHYSEEFTLTTQHPEHRPLVGLLHVLRRLRRRGTMPTTIVAHLATPVAPWGERASHHLLTSAMLGDFANAPLYADISALTALSKTGWLRGIARRQELHGKLLFGSDFPVPLGWPFLRRKLGRRVCNEIRRRQPAWPNQAVEIFRHAGFNEIVFHRAAALLPNLDFFAGGDTGVAGTSAAGWKPAPSGFGGRS